MTRRQALGALAALALARPARAAEKVVRIERGDFGTTWRLALESAPFPDGRAPWKDPTVLVFAPRGLAAGAGVDAVVHFHGLNGTADEAMAEHQLREQVAESRRAALLVVPQGPVRARDDVSGGKLERPGGLARLLDEVTATVGFGAVGRVALSAHSGGYQAAARSLERGGCDVTDVFLFDALSGFPRIFRQWLVGGVERRLVSYVQGPVVRRYAARLRQELEHAHVPVIDRDAPAAGARAVFIRTRVPHGDIPVTGGALRECLSTSHLHVIPSSP